MAYYGITSLKVHNNLKCSNTSKHCQWSGIKPTEHTCIWSMKTINNTGTYVNIYTITERFLTCSSVKSYD